MSRAGSSSRSVGGFLAAVAAAAAMVVFAAPAGAQDPGEGLIPEGDWTQDQIDYMLDKIAETEEVLPATFPPSGTYEELEAALAPMGFHDFGVPAPGGYYHWINNDWLDDDTMDPAEAESLVYQQQGDGTYRLVSAMFMLSPSTTMDTIPEEIAWLPGLHVHPELCVSLPDFTFVTVTDPEDPDCPEGSVPAVGAPMMHVWLEDPGCNHRFGGVGVQGLHCDHGGHGDHDDHDDHDDHGHDDDHGDDDHDDHGDDDQGHDDDDDHGHDDDHGDDDHGHDERSPAAAPVVGEPSYTG